MEKKKNVVEIVENAVFFSMLSILSSPPYFQGYTPSWVRILQAFLRTFLVFISTFY